MGQKTSRRWTEENLDASITGFASVEEKQVDATLAFPFLQDHKTVNYIKGSRVMIILRGLSGSGKSFLANKIFERYKHCCTVCSADDYFVQSDGSYQFEKTLLRDAHEHCQQKAVAACKDGIPMVILDNTNIKLWEMEFYARLAQKLDYIVIILEPKTDWKFNVGKLILHSTHNINQEIICIRISQWEQCKPLFYGWFLNCTDSKNLLDIGQAYFETCFEIPEFYSELQNICRTSNKKEMISFYSCDGMAEKGSILHCTAKFCAGARGSKLQEYINKKEVRNGYGKSFTLKIIGFFISTNTFGARVKLSTNQLKLWNMDDNESIRTASDASSDFILNSMQRMSWRDKQSAPKSPLNNHQLLNSSLLNFDKSDCSCIPTLRIVGQTCDDTFMPCSELGSRAHITLGCAPEVQPRQTGLDLINVVKHEQNAAKHSASVPTYNISIGKLRHYSSGLWVIYPDKVNLVETMFTFH